MLPHTSGNVSIDGNIFGRFYEGNRALLDREIETHISPKLRYFDYKYELKFDRVNKEIHGLNNTVIKINERSSRPVSYNSSQGSMGSQIRSIQPMSMTYTEGTRARYAGFVPQDTDLYFPSLTSPPVLETIPIDQKKARIKELET